MSFNTRLLTVIACPKCKGDLEYQAEQTTLRCKPCQLIYPIEEGIPVLLIDQARAS